MNLIINTIRRFLVFILVIPFFQSTAFAQPFLIPGFLAVESSYIAQPESDSNTTSAYFTLTNLHDEPILILSASGDIFESSSLRNSSNEELEYIEVLPRERLVMGSSGMHIQLNELDDSITTGDTVELALLVRRGREAMEYVEEFFDSSIRETFGGGIPNEKEYIMHVSVGN